MREAESEGGLVSSQRPVVCLRRGDSKTQNSNSIKKTSFSRDSEGCKMNHL